LKSKLNFFRQD